MADATTTSATNIESRNRRIVSSRPRRLRREGAHQVARAVRPAVPRVDRQTPRSSGATAAGGAALVQEVGQGARLERARTPSGSSAGRRTSPTTASTARSSRAAATRPRSSGKASPRRPAAATGGDGPPHHLQAAARRRLPLRQRPEEARREEGRPRHDLHADGPRGRRRDARLRAHRRGALGDLRRVLAARRSPTASRTPSRTSSSPPTAASAAGRSCR